MIIGQKKLLEKLNNYNIDCFPRSIILIGEEGMGKHLISKYISENILKLPLLDISEHISNEYIDAIYINPNPNIYLINLSLMTEKEQNILLKFVEEPLNNSFIILLAENKNFVLNTVLNRCVSFELESYSRNELAQFIDDNLDKDLILKVIKSPGRIKNTNLNTINDVFNLCDKIIEKMSIANYANTLSIANKINFKDDYNKIDFNLFFDSLEFSLFSNFLKTNNKNILTMYNLTRDERKKLIDKRLNKEIFFEHFISKLWRQSKGEN